MTWFAVNPAAVGIGTIGGAADGCGAWAGGVAAEEPGRSLAMWTILSLAIALATLAFTALATALFFSVVGSSPASAAAVGCQATGIGDASASSSSPSLARPNSLAKGLVAAGRSLLATSVSTLMPALRAASSEFADGTAPRLVTSASANA